VLTENTHSWPQVPGQLPGAGARGCTPASDATRRPAFQGDRPGDFRPAARGNGAIREGGWPSSANAGRWCPTQVGSHDGGTTTDAPATHVLGHANGCKAKSAPIPSQHIAGSCGPLLAPLEAFRLLSKQIQPTRGIHNHGGCPEWGTYSAAIPPTGCSHGAVKQGARACLEGWPETKAVGACTMVTRASQNG
jgi:hypothetical protein